jgi:hypothetical protein
MTKRETCKWASPAPLYRNDELIGYSDDFSVCAAPVPACVYPDRFCVNDEACEDCECWAAKDAARKGDV